MRPLLIAIGIALAAGSIAPAGWSAPAKKVVARKPVAKKPAAVEPVADADGAASAPPATAAAPAPPPPPPGPPPQLRSMQYLYGSAEAAAITRQAWHAMVQFVEREAGGERRRGTVLAPGSTLTNPTFAECGDKPPAIVLDVDETAILNLGAEYDDLMSGRPDMSSGTWSRWERGGASYVMPTPGAKEALDELREKGVTVIFNSNRTAVNAVGAESALNAAGLGPAKHGETLFLMGDDDQRDRKDARRQVIASRFCVVAMGGDQLGDFSDLFNTEPNGVASRRATVGFAGIADMWGNGWFLFPNPVYGSALQGTADDLFPRDKQWRDPGPAAAPAPAPAAQPAPAPAAASPQ